MIKEPRDREKLWHDKHNDTMKKTVRNHKETADVYIWVDNQLTTTILDPGSRDESGTRDLMRFSRKEDLRIDSKKIKQCSYWLNMSPRKLLGEMLLVQDAMLEVLIKRKKDERTKKSKTNPRLVHYSDERTGFILHTG